MRILHVIASIAPTHGGPSSSAPSLAVAQAHAGHDVTLVYHRTVSQEEVLKAAENNVDHISDLKLVDIPQDNLSEKLFAIRAARTMRQLISQSDIVQIHGIWDPIVVRAAFIAMKLKKNYVITPRGMLNPWSLSKSRWRKRLMLFFAVDRMLRGSLFIHALNSTEAETIKAISGDYHTKIFPNGIFASRLSTLPSMGIFFRQHPELNGRRYILFLGRLHHVKGLDFAAEAFAEFSRKVPDVDLVIAGPDDGALVDFKRRIAVHKIDNRVHIVGPLYGDAKYAAMVDAMCLLQPSRQEGFSMSILEAMVCGVPVVISQHCHFPEVKTFNCGDVVPLDSYELEKALVDIARDSERASAMGAAARDLVLNNYTWDSIGIKMVAAYACLQARH